MSRETQDSEIQKRVELVRLKARQAGNMAPEQPGVMDASAKIHLGRLVPPREQLSLDAIEVDRLPPLPDPKPYIELVEAEVNNIATGITIEQEAEEAAAAQHDFTMPDTTGLEASIAEQNNSLADEANAAAGDNISDMSPRVRLSFIDRIIQAESGGDPNAVSPAGASGIMQIMPDTAADPGFGVTPIAWEDIFNPVLNRKFGTEYVEALLSRYDGDEEAALIAYNAGAGNADKWLEAGRDYAVLPRREETEPYVNKIMNNFTLAPATTLIEGEVSIDHEAVAMNMPRLGEATAAIAGNEMAQVGAQIPGLSQEESIRMYLYPRAGETTEDLDLSEELGGPPGHSAGIGEEPFSNAMYADVKAHYASLQALEDMRHLPQVQEAFVTMPNNMFIAWMDATRSLDPRSKEIAEGILLANGFRPRGSRYDEMSPSDRFFNMFAYDGRDGYNIGAYSKANAGKGPLRVVLDAARRMVFNR